VQEVHRALVALALALDVRLMTTSHRTRGWSTSSPAIVRTT
jgi:hypothetical protein